MDIIGENFIYNNVRYTCISKLYTESGSLCDYYSIARAEPFEGPGEVATDLYHVVIGFEMDKRYKFGIKPVKIFVKNQISRAGNHIYPETIEV